MIDQNIIDAYSSLNQELLRYDWMVSPYCSNGEYDKIRNLIKKLPVKPSKKGCIGKLLGDLTIRGDLGYRFRSVIVFERYRIAPNIKKISHLYESGLFELYRLNFISCLGIWIPLVEGILRSFLGIDFGKLPKDYGKLLQAKRAKYAGDQLFLETIIKAVVNYLSEKFYNKVNSSKDLSTDNFNRHFFSHLISHEPLYCRENCLRLLHVFDSLLAIDVIIDNGFRISFDGMDKRVKEREQYYEHLMRDALSGKEIFKIKLLKDHPYFDDKFYYGIKK